MKCVYIFLKVTWSDDDFLSWCVAFFCWFTKSRECKKEKKNQVQQPQMCKQNIIFDSGSGKIKHHIAWLHVYRQAGKNNLFCFVEQQIASATLILMTIIDLCPSPPYYLTLQISEILFLKFDFNFDLWFIKL